MRPLSVVALALLAGALCTSAQLDLRSYRDETYAVQAIIGTPATGKPNQEFYLSVDAFGSDITVAGVDCWQCCNKARYDATLSTTNKGSCKANADGAYGTKSDACTDTFQSGTVNIPSAPFTEVVSSPSVSPFVASPSDGTVGLSSQVYGYYFTRTCSNDGAKGGTIKAGALDTTNCLSPASVTLTLTADTNKVLSTPLTNYQVDSDAVVPAPTGGWLATFTTTSPNVTIPRTEFDTINSKYFSVQPDNTFDCAKLPATTVKPIKLTFPAATTGGAAQVLSFDIQQLVFRTDDGKCALRLLRQNDDAKQAYWEFGLPLFRAYCALVNVKDTAKTIAFAPPKARNDACTYNKLAPVPECHEPATTSTTETSTTEFTVTPNVTQSTTPKGASRGQVMSVLSVFVMFAFSALF